MKPRGVAILCGRRRPLLIRARRAVCAMPLHVAARIVPRSGDWASTRRHHRPPQAPWLVANFLLDGFPANPADAPLAWDNVIPPARPLAGWSPPTS